MSNRTHIRTSLDAADWITKQAEKRGITRAEMVDLLIEVWKKKNPRAA